MTYPSWLPPTYMEPSELTTDNVVSPSSRILAFVKDFFEIAMLFVGMKLNERMLRTWYISLMMGRNKGKQAPTIPSDDSTIGQYRVGVNISSNQLVSECYHYWLCEHSYM